MHRVNVWEWNNAFLWIISHNAFAKGVHWWHGTPIELEDDVTPNAVRRSHHCTQRRRSNGERKSDKSQYEYVNGCKKNSERDDRRKILAIETAATSLLSLILLNIFARGLAACQFMHQIQISDSVSELSGKVFRKQHRRRREKDGLKKTVSEIGTHSHLCFEIPYESHLEHKLKPSRKRAVTVRLRTNITQLNLNCLNLNIKLISLIYCRTSMRRTNEK